LVSILFVVERLAARRPVGVGCAIDVDVHAMREDRKVLRGRRELGLWWGRSGALRVKGTVEEQGSGEGEGSGMF